MRVGIPSGLKNQPDGEEDIFSEVLNCLQTDWSSNFVPPVILRLSPTYMVILKMIVAFSCTTYLMYFIVEENYIHFNEPFPYKSLKSQKYYSSSKLSNDKQGPLAHFTINSSNRTDWAKKP